MDIRLSDVEDKGIVASKDARERRCETGFSLARDVYLYDFDVVTLHIRFAHLLLHLDKYTNFYVTVIQNGHKTFLLSN